MATNVVTQSLLSGLLEKTKKAYTSKAKNFLNLKTSPLANFIPKDFSNNVISLTPSQSLLGKFKLHPSVLHLAVALAIYLGVGTLIFYTALDDLKGKKQSPLVDALYFTVVTMTTVGYGDLVPASSYVKVLCCVFVLTGMTLFGLILSKAADYIVEKQEKLLIKALSKQQKYGFTKEVEKKTDYTWCIFALVTLGILMLVAVIFLYTVEDLDFIDSIYCVCTTITTLGYGDKAFSTENGRVFAIIWILVSTFGLGQFFLYVADEFVDVRQRAFVNWILTKRVTTNLNSPDIDNDGVLEVAEFAVNRLKEKGKIKQEDISRLMREFEELDVQKCGFVPVSDMVFPQSKR